MGAGSLSNTAWVAWGGGPLPSCWQPLGISYTVIFRAHLTLKVGWLWSAEQGRSRAAGPLAELAREGAGCRHRAPAAVPGPHSDPWHLKKKPNQTGQLLVLPLFPWCIHFWQFFPLIHAAGKVRGHRECGGTVTQLSPGDVFCRSRRRGGRKKQYLILSINISGAVSRFFRSVKKTPALYLPRCHREGPRRGHSLRLTEHIAHGRGWRRGKALP